MTQQTATPPKATRHPTRSKQLADIHSWAQKAGFKTVGKEGDPRRAGYEAELKKVAGVTSARQVSRQTRLDLIDHFRRQADATYRLAHARPVEAFSDDDALGVL